MATEAKSSPFWRPVDLSRTALLLSDVQSQVLFHMPEPLRAPYLSRVSKILTHFRTEIAARRAAKPASEFQVTPNEGIPLILHHVVPVGLNHNSFISPYNKLNTWALQRVRASPLPPSAADPNTPWYAIPGPILPLGGWSADEIVVGKIQPSSFVNSDVLTYLRARDIRHIVLVGLTTGGSVLSSVRLASDLDFHVIVPRGGCWDEDDVHEVILEKLLPRFCDVVEDEDIDLLV